MSRQSGPLRRLSGGVGPHIIAGRGLESWMGAAGVLLVVLLLVLLLLRMAGAWRHGDDAHTAEADLPLAGGREAAADVSARRGRGRLRRHVARRLGRRSRWLTQGCAAHGGGCCHGRNADGNSGRFLRATLLAALLLLVKRGGRRRAGRSGHRE